MVDALLVLIKTITYLLNIVQVRAKPYNQHATLRLRQPLLISVKTFRHYLIQRQNRKEN